MQLATKVATPSPAEVDEYLRRYPDIAAIVPAICTAARDRFGPDTQLSLEVYHDPEIEDEYLALYVRQQSYDPNIMTSIEQVASTFDGVLANSLGWIQITTDFRPPR